MDSVSNGSEKLNDADVLIVGGSLVGLTAAMLLAWQGVRVVLVETHEASHPHPRAIGFTERTLEIFRQVGIDARIPEVPADHRLLRCTVDSLAGIWQEPQGWTPGQRGSEPSTASYSPRGGASIAQDRLEPILRERAVELGADLRLGHELVSFQQGPDDVTACVRDRRGRTATLRAAFMVAADGSRSTVRAALGIGRKGPGVLRTMRSVLFRAPLDGYLARGVSQFNVVQPDFRAFLTTYADGRWVLMFDDDRERDELALRAAIERAIGRSDLPVEILTTGRWELTALIADRFASGRVFLAGDAAHTLPPTRGGFGANTGIHDAHNLAWKLAAVLQGAASPALLETYDAERRPVAWTRLEQTFARPDYAAFAAGYADGVTLLGDTALELGQRVASSAVIEEGTDLPVAARPDEWRGQPGTRAAHLWLGDRARGVSTLDAFGLGWTLMSDDPRWEAPAVASGARSLTIGEDDAERFREAYGLRTGGASLVRPDGIIAWRSVGSPDDRQAVLAEVLRRVARAGKRDTASSGAA